MKDEMRINSIKIEKLFEIFDYDISFNNKENLRIITGPNGFGKTMILNIIFNLFNRKFFFFQKLLFEKISVFLQDNIAIIISKKTEKNESNVKFTFTQNGENLGVFDYSDKLENEVWKNISKFLPVGRIDENTWVDHRTDRVLNRDILLNEYADQLPEAVSRNILRIKSPEINTILDSVKVHLIREQRLFKKVPNIERNYRERNYREEKDQTIMIETIQTYGEKLKQLISHNSQQSFKISQELDSSYPDRLINEKDKLTK
ncbi:MAG: hypothetical protein BWK75_00205, partial [Candidatus Altiarchaeales archaeon A3]